MSLSPVKAYSDAHGYNYVETADWWKEACSVLPSFTALQWPDYSSVIVEDTIHGKPVVIQLWKGWCQRFLGRDDFPGGIGAEVGIYQRVPGRTVPDSLPFLPSQMATFLLGAVKSLGDEHLFWPVTDLNAEVEFEFINPITNETFFRAGPENTYWLNKWMNPASYKEYKRAREKRWSWLPSWIPGNSHTPVFAAEYLLSYTINGKTYPRW